MVAVADLAAVEALAVLLAAAVRVRDAALVATPLTLDALLLVPAALAVATLAGMLSLFSTEA